MKDDNRNASVLVYNEKKQSDTKQSIRETYLMMLQLLAFASCKSINAGEGNQGYNIFKRVSVACSSSVAVKGLL